MSYSLFFILIEASFTFVFCAHVFSHNCTNGPYIFDSGCLKPGEGIGSALNHMKFMFLISEAFNVKYIPDHRCLVGRGHADFSRSFGWDSDCSYEVVVVMQEEGGDDERIKLIDVDIDDKDEIKSSLYSKEV